MKCSQIQNFLNAKMKLEANSTRNLRCMLQYSTGIFKVFITLPLGYVCNGNEFHGLLGSNPKVSYAKEGVTKSKPFQF